MRALIFTLLVLAACGVHKSYTHITNTQPLGPEGSTWYVTMELADQSGNGDEALQAKMIKDEMSRFCENVGFNDYTVGAVYCYQSELPVKCSFVVQCVHDENVDFDGSDPNW